MKPIILFIFLICLFLQPSQLLAEGLDAKSLLLDIEKRGVLIVGHELYSNQDKWNQLLSNIATGRNEWVEIAFSLRNGSGTAGSEMIMLTLGEALEHNPENVIRAISSLSELNLICSGPDVDDLKYDSYELSIMTINRRIAKIASVKSRDIKNNCNECIKHLENSKKGIATFYQIEN